MGIAKIILNNTSQIDLTSDTVTASTLLSGYTAHDASGEQITGTASSGGTSIVVTDVTNNTGTTCQITGEEGSSGVNFGADLDNNIAQLFYRVSTGNCVTGSFTLANNLPNTPTTVFSTGLSSVTGCAYIDVTTSEYQTASTPEYSIFGYYQTDGTNTYTFSLRSTRSISGNQFLTRVSSYEFSNGDLIVTATYNSHVNYTPFYAGHTYKWIAW